MPIKALFRSRKFLLALFAVIQTLVFHYADVPPDIWQAIDALVALLILAIAGEDMAMKAAGNHHLQNGKDDYTPGEF